MSLEKEKQGFLEEIQNLKKESNNLNDIVLKFTKGQKNLELLLGSQKCAFDKSGIGYKPHAKQKFYKIFFVKPTPKVEVNATCNYCNAFGHLSHRRSIKRNVFGINMMWVPKETKNNTQGPKKIWVPKIST